MAHIEMSLLSIECFTNDGRLDADELGKLIALAEKDGKITQEEISVLTSVIKRIRPDEVTPDMRTRLKALGDKFGI